MIPTWAWIVTIVLIGGLFLYDYFFHVRVAHTPTLKESTIWSILFVAIALLFGVFVWVAFGHQRGVEYFAGYITEKALSVDNLFVFLIIMAGFKVPHAYQQKVLLFGILFSIFARAVFILAGAALLNSFAWMFYIFGGLLLMLAGKQLAPEKEEESLDQNIVVRVTRKMFTLQNGKRALTPMLLVMVVIGATDILFALDSIPAIFGLTDSAFIVFTANAFSLMGLRQLYFLIDGLLERLVYLKYGLAIILAFIGAKLILHALHENNVPIINDGNPVSVIEVTTGQSLIVI
ncbi:MAG TPA: TerC/Alx family metal homeostasis membrane protein, partial [Acidovorax sp.]|nr:TerC/Alx family metal homeostasis membrane protein [Acidovorax sp.]